MTDEAHHPRSAHEDDLALIERALDETNYPPGTQLWLDAHAAVERLAKALGVERIAT